MDPENKWVNETIDLSQWSGGTLQLRFRGTMNKGKERSNVDHVLITGLTSGPQPVLPELAITNANPPNQEDATGTLLFEVTRSGDLSSSSSATWMITGTGTNPANADDGTIRKDFGESVEANSVHGSDSIENAKLEINFFFADIDIVT